MTGNDFAPQDPQTIQQQQQRQMLFSGSDPMMRFNSAPPMNLQDLDPQNSHMEESNGLVSNPMTQDYSPMTSLPDQQRLLMLQLQQQQHEQQQLASQFNGDPRQLDQDPDAPEASALVAATPQTDLQQKMDKLQFQADQPRVDVPQYAGAAPPPPSQYGDPAAGANLDFSQKMGKLQYEDPAENIKRQLKSIAPAQLLDQSGLYANPNRAQGLLPRMMGQKMPMPRQNLWNKQQHPAALWGRNRPFIKG